MSNKSSGDELLDELADAVRSVSDEFEQQENYALLVLAAKIDDPTSIDSDISSFFGVTGFNDVLEEALITELASQIQEGNLALFASIRRVIHTLEQEMDLSPEEELDEGLTPDDYPKTLH